MRAKITSPALLTAWIVGAFLLLMTALAVMMLPRYLRIGAPSLEEESTTLFERTLDSSAIAPGEHTLTFRVRTAAGEQTEASTTFVVDDTSDETPAVEAPSESLIESGAPLLFFEASP